MFRKTFALFSCLTFLPGLLRAFAQTDDDTARVTVTINPDGSKTVYQKDGAAHRATATTTAADGKPRGKIVYQLNSDGRYETGEVLTANGTLRFKTRYQYNAAGRLLAETQLGKDGATRNKIVYHYDAAGNPEGYEIYDGDGKLLGQTNVPAEKEAKARRTPR